MDERLSGLLQSFGFARLVGLLADEASERAAARERDGDLVGESLWLDIAGQLGTVARTAATIR